jgi:hypothetical protein
MTPEELNRVMHGIQWFPASDLCCLPFVQIRHCVNSQRCASGLVIMGLPVSQQRSASRLTNKTLDSQCPLSSPRPHVWALAHLISDIRGKPNLDY